MTETVTFTRYVKEGSKIEQIRFLNQIELKDVFITVAEFELNAGKMKHGRELFTQQTIFHSKHSYFEKIGWYNGPSELGNNDMFNYARVGCTSDLYKNITYVKIKTVPIYE